MRESFFLSTLRYFFISFFLVFGIFAGIFAGVLLLSTSSDTESSPEVEKIYTPEIAANGNGIRQKYSETTPTILKLNIEGIIGSDRLNMQTLEMQLLESREGIFKKNPIKALLLHIRSPGGTVVDADGIYRALKHYKEQYHIPVYAYVDGLCASGGMYIAAAADKIHASEVSLIGSIGVVTPPIFNFSKIMEKYGLDALTMSAGTGKDNLNPFRPWKPDESAEYQKIINDYYTHFVDIIADSRKMNREKLVGTYGANIFPAKEAKECGFIDEAGVSLNETMEQLKKAAAIENEDYQVIQLEKKNFLLGLFSSDLLSSSLLQGKVEHKVDIGVNLPPELMNQFLYLYRPGL